MTGAKYTDAAMEADRERGYQDGLAGRHGNTRGVVWVSAYMTGYSDGSAKHNEAVRAKRIANLRRRKVKP
jgi:hypothetical protein